MVARLVRDQKVAGSNPVTSIEKSMRFEQNLMDFLCILAKNSALCAASLKCANPVCNEIATDCNWRLWGIHNIKTHLQDRALYLAFLAMRPFGIVCLDSSSASKKEYKKTYKMLIAWQVSCYTIRESEVLPWNGMCRHSPSPIRCS